MADYDHFDSRDELIEAAREVAEPGDDVVPYGDICVVKRNGVVVWRGVHD